MNSFCTPVKNVQPCLVTIELFQELASIHRKKTCGRCEPHSEYLGRCSALQDFDYKIVIYVQLGRCQIWLRNRNIQLILGLAAGSPAPRVTGFFHVCLQGSIISFREYCFLPGCLLDPASEALVLQTRRRLNHNNMQLI